MKKQYQLSKSSFIKGLQCRKALWMYYNAKELRDPVSPSQQAIFDRGHDVGRLAQQLFPNGIDLSEKYGFDYSGSIVECSKLLKPDEAVIYEAPFQYNGVMNLLDILVKKKGKIYAYEVKSSTKISDTYIYDAAIQYWVITNAGYQLKDFSIVYINNDYVRWGGVEVSKLFNVESVIDLILPLQEQITELVEEFKSLVTSSNNPDIKIGSHCFEPYSCDFHSHCWKDVPDYSVIDIAGLFFTKKMELIESNIFRFKDIPDNFPLNDSQWQQVDCELEHKSIINKKAIKEFVDNLQYPLHFMDFETINPAVPLFDNSSPYQQIPFQYSLHNLKSKNEELKHREFLADAVEGQDPRVQFINQLIADLGDKGDIIVYNQGFEKGILERIASQFPEYSLSIDAITARLKDLMQIFRHRHYYTPEMRGSYSIKQVLPALVPGLSYDGLDIAEGSQASSAYLDLFAESDSFKVRQIREKLLQYCKMDTLAMVEILSVLERLED